jgi:hypothetical protein
VIKRSRNQRSVKTSIKLQDLFLLRINRSYDLRVISPGSINPFHMSYARQICISALLAFCSVGAQTVLNPGDLAIVGINANNTACSGVVAQDEVSFFCFKSLTANTRIWVTDCGYEKLTAGLWGDSEGVIELRRNAAAPVLAANTVITFRATNASGAGNVAVVAPLADVANWTVNVLNVGAAFNLNSGGDQIFFIQPNTIPAGAFNNPGGADNATFPNCRILYGFSTVAPPNDWVSLQNNSQRSGLPPGMICFSMAPSAGSDFIKYVAPAPDVFPVYTTRSQRQWIIEIDDQTRWVNEGSCATYNAPSATSPNYAGGFVFPVSVGGFVNGIWTGAKSTDWFDCRNWDDAEVPIVSSNVVINPVNAPINSCVIGVAVSPPTAVCNTIAISSAGLARTLTVQNVGTLQVTAGITVTNTGLSGFNGLTLLSGSITCGGLTLSGTGGFQGGFRSEVAGNPTQVNGNVTINSGGYLDLRGVGIGGTLQLTGNYANNVDATAFDELGSTVVFNGTAAQSISTALAFTEDFGAMSLAKPTNDLTLNAPINVRSNFALGIGRLMTTNTNILTMLNGSGFSGSSDLSFIHGPMIKIGPSIPIVQFPVGKANRLHPIAVSNYTIGATDAFIAEYFGNDPNTDIGIPYEIPLLDHISSCEYWRLEQFTGTPVGKVTLQWKAPTSCGVTVLSGLRVARWDGAMWRDRGNGGAAGTPAFGTIPTAAAQELVFTPGYWTLASVDNTNPLPIELLTFTARPEGSEVRLDWTTASELENDYFTVERSVNGADFTDVLRTDGAGNSTQLINYSDRDHWPLSGVSYYRLRQTDVNGTSTTSDVVSVSRPHADGSGIALVNAASEVTAIHDLPVGSEVHVLDMTGRLVWQGRVQIEGRTVVPLSSLSPGTYVLRISSDARSESAPFVR